MDNIMYDSKGNLRNGYKNERSEEYILRNLETGNVIDRRLRTPSEAADLNYFLRETNQRWIPFTGIDPDVIQALSAHSALEN